MQKLNLLDLPSEIRLNIYDHALPISSTFAIGALERDPELRQQRADLYEPRYESVDPVSLAAPGFHPSLLDNSANQYAAADRVLLMQDCQHYIPPQDPLALYTVCKQIYDELHHHGARYSAPLKLYVGFPAGIKTLLTDCKHLLLRAKTIHVMGLYDFGGINDLPTARRNGPRIGTCLPENLQSACKDLGRLTRAAFGENPSLLNLAALSLRFGYTGLAGHFLDPWMVSSTVKGAVNVGNVYDESWQCEAYDGGDVHVTRNDEDVKSTLHGKKFPNVWTIEKWLFDHGWIDGTEGVEGMDPAILARIKTLEKLPEEFLCHRHPLDYLM